MDFFQKKILGGPGVLAVGKTLFPVLFIISAMSLLLHAEPPASATPGPESGSSVGTVIGIDAGKSGEVRITSGTDRPKLVVKTYILKHADPYEVREILQKVLSGARTSESQALVESILYSDGTGAVIVTAEDYRFRKDDAGGQSIGEVVAMLDKPGVKKEDGGEYFVYRPKHRNASDLAVILVNIGLRTAGDRTELDAGSDAVFIDHGGNSLLIRAAPAEIRRVKELLAASDQPVPQWRISLRLYKTGFKSREEIGNRFKEWKDGPGSGLFSAGAKYSAGADGESKLHFIRADPVWTSEFLDLLAESGAASKTCSGMLLLSNGQAGLVRGRELAVEIKASIAEKSAVLDVRIFQTDAAGKSGTVLYSTRVQTEAGGSSVIGVSSQEGASTEKTGIPLLMDIPLAGWIFGSEKKVPFVEKTILTLDAAPARPGDGIPEDAAKAIREIKETLEKTFPDP